MSTHYTAVIEINRTTAQEEEVDAYGKVKQPAKRNVADVARVVVRADSVEALAAKASAHLALVEDVA